MRFADFHDGQTIEAGQTTLGEQEIIEFARQYDPQWFHTDAQAARDGPFGGLIASGWQTTLVAMQLFVARVLHGSEALASPGINYIKWPAPVRPGDTLRLRVEVIEARRSRSNPQRGVLRARWRLANQQDVEVLDLEATTLFGLKD